MNKAMLARLEKIEGATGGVLPLLIVRFVVNGDGERIEHDAYKDMLGNVWRREAGESPEDFEGRAGAAAIAAAPRGSLASILSCGSEAL